MPDKTVIAADTIAQHHAAAVLYVLRLEGGVNPGGFVEKLLEAALVADVHNRARLELGFQGLISAVRLYKEAPHGTQLLQKIAAGKPIDLPVDSA